MINGCEWLCPHCHSEFHGYVMCSLAKSVAWEWPNSWVKTDLPFTLFLVASFQSWHTPADRTISDGIVQVKLRLWFSDAIGTYWNTQPSWSPQTIPNASEKSQTSPSQLSQEDPNGIGTLKSWYHAVLRYTKQSQGDDDPQQSHSPRSIPGGFSLEGKLVMSASVYLSWCSNYIVT